MRAFTGKASERMRITIPGLPRQINVDPELARIIRLRAERKMRPIGVEIRYLLTAGVCADPEQTVHEHFLTHAHAMSPERTVAHTDSHPAKAGNKNRSESRKEICA